MLYFYLRELSKIVTHHGSKCKRSTRVVLDKDAHQPMPLWRNAIRCACPTTALRLATVAPATTRPRVTGAPTTSTRRQYHRYRCTCTQSGRSQRGRRQVSSNVCSERERERERESYACRCRKQTTLTRWLSTVQCRCRVGATTPTVHDLTPRPAEARRTNGCCPGCDCRLV